MKKRKKTVEDVLARAEKLFQRGTFPLAKKEFEKAQKKLKREDIADKIEICRREAGRLKAKELIKQARKAEKRSDLNKALSCFEQAVLNSDEEWIIKKIGQLKVQLGNRNALFAAREAEAAANYEKAAALYARADQAGETGNLLLKKAKCLVRAEKYTEAVTTYKVLSLADSGDRYDYGLALAKTGHIRACLDVWDGIDTADVMFAEQIRTVRRCLAADLYDRFEKKGNPVVIYHDAHYLLNSADPGLNENQIRLLKDLLEYCKYECINELWETESFDKIADLLEPAPTNMMPHLLTLYAKIWFNLATNDGKHLNTLIPFWLTAVYSRQIATKFGIDTATREKVREKLLEVLENLIKKQSDNENGQQALIYLKIENKLIRELSHLADERKDRTHLVCTPLYALRSGQSDDIIDLIREKRAFFMDTRQYLETGAYYSAAGPCLYLIKSHEYEKAIDILEALPPEIRSDEFFDYAAKLVYFEFSMDCIVNDESRFMRYFKTVPALFEMVPAYEEQFIAKAIAVEDWSTLKAYEEALFYIHKHRPSKAIRKTLSLVMTQRAMALYNEGQLGRKAMQALTNKALQLYPENEMARGALKSTMIYLETQEMDQAFRRHKLSKAGRIARQTEFPEVQDQYFDYVESIFEDLQKTDFSQDEKLLILNEVYASAKTVDWKHPVVGKMRMLLDLDSERKYE
ncbi:MAG: hypothetical protein JRE12_12090 [Deltaproteobacteria bacterium]|nr:hypothetical protein [Deltaproteobacteria bacterium]